MGLVLGLDIGSKSIGWTLIDKGDKPSIADIGVRVFPEGVDRDTKGLEKSKNTTRREARGARRMRFRRNMRRNRIIRELKNAGMLPKEKIEFTELLKNDPYLLRRKGLDEKLELYEFGRALFHLNQRRGFKSNRKSGKSKENGVVIKSATELQKLMDEKGSRTLGEYFSSIDPEETRIRSKYTFRSMYETEFDMLWNKQSEFYPELLTDELRKKIREETIFFQRPLRPSDELIGDCQLEQGEKRCPRGDWYARKFRLLQDINNLKIQNPDGKEQNLTDEQRKIIFEELSQKKEITFDKIRDKLGLMETQIFNLEQDGKVEKLKGDIFNTTMRSKNIFGPTVWDAMNEEEKVKLNDDVLYIEDDELKAKLIAEYKLTQEQADKVLDIPFPAGYMSYSRKAIIKFLPFMENGSLTSEAIDKAGYKRDNVEKGSEINELPLPPDVRNPIVQKALYEVRKIVNAIIKEYGKPAKIIIEMARDVKGNAKQREELQKKMWDNERENERARTRLIQDCNTPNPKRDDIIKYKLWEECGQECPYTGKHISQAALFGHHPEYQVEHILPYDRSLDDSYMNKALCYVDENRRKGNQTPYEVYGHDEKRFEEMLQRVNKSAMPYAKKQKFWQKEIELDKIIERELNDTRYICREVIAYLKQLGIYVRGSRGKITAELRHQWGLDDILDLSGNGMKNRDDHRHHAVDAVVTAVTENEHLRKLAKSKYSVSGNRFELPWPDFRQELQEKVKHINVSHRVTKKVSGPLHEETSYGLTGRKDEKGQDILVYRKKLEDLTMPMVENIVDPVVREIVQNRLKEKGIDTDGDRKISKEIWTEPLYMKTTKSNKKVLIKKVRIQTVSKNTIKLKDENGKDYRAVEPGSNHHIEIFEYTDNKENVKREGRVITMYDAVRRSKNKEPVIKRDYGDGKKFVSSLAINELFMLEDDKGNKELHRVQKISQNGQIFFRHHTFAGDLAKEAPISKVPNKLKGSKVTIDPLGRIFPAND